LTLRYIYFIGTAGSGKSTMVQAFREWMELQGLDCISVNLDPGADAVPYGAEVDIRDWIRLSDIMEEYNLGPNGAQIVSSDLMAVNIEEWAPVINEFHTDYVLIDTPGQMELFTFRQSSEIIIEEIGRDDSFLVFLSDPQLSKTPNGFVSSLMLCALTHFRFSIPILNVLSKSDMLSQEELDLILDWAVSPDSLNSNLVERDFSSQSLVNLEFFKAMENIGMFRELTPVSSIEFTGLEEVYNTIQQAFMGGEDLSRD
jgi:hypothetical protein